MHRNAKLPYIQIPFREEPLIVGFPSASPQPLPTTPAWFPKLPFDSQEGSHILEANIGVQP